MSPMKRNVLLLSVLLAIVFVPAVVSAVGNISVTSSPVGASVYLDGISTGLVTPTIVENVASGSHTILLKFTGYQDFSQANLQVTDNSTSTVSATLTSLVSNPTITGVSPPTGYNTGYLRGVVISGTGFSGPVTVSLTMTGQSAISGVNVVNTSTSVTCDFNIYGASAGAWNVVVLNSDGGTYTKTGAITVIASSATNVTSITPTTGTVNTTVSITNLAGNGFQSNAQMLLRRSGYNDIPGVETSISSTQIIGTFNLNNVATGDYTVCVLYDGTNPVCGPTFTINTPNAVNGSISFTSNPSGAGAYLNNVFQATTPYTLGNVTPGTYTVTYKLSGYQDLSQQVTVTAGQTADAYGYLRTNYVYTTAPTPVYTVPPTVRTVATAKKPAITVPTPWPSATPAKSPADLLVVLGAVGIGIAVLRRR